MRSLTNVFFFIFAIDTSLNVQCIYVPIFMQDCNKNINTTVFYEIKQTILIKYACTKLRL